MACSQTEGPGYTPVLSLGEDMTLDELKGVVREVLQEDHEILLEMQVTMKAIQQSIADHESRIRLIERAIGYGLGALGMAKLIMDMVAKK